jgi:hypothetical protein
MEYIAMTGEVTVSELEQMKLWFPKARIDIISSALEAEDLQENKEQKVAEIEPSAREVKTVYGKFRPNFFCFEFSLPTFLKKKKVRVVRA